MSDDRAGLNKGQGFSAISPVAELFGLGFLAAFASIAHTFRHGHDNSDSGEKSLARYIFPGPRSIV